MVWEKTITFRSENRDYCVHYFVLPPAPCPELPAPCYGLGLACADTSCTVTAFSPDKDETIRVARMLARNLVTPTSFYEIMDDYLAAL